MTNYETGDFITFKYFTNDNDVITCKGKILSLFNNGMEIQSDQNVTWIKFDMIIKHYPKSIVNHLTVRHLLKELWKNFTFREVKTVKAKDPHMVTYQYINQSGFVRSEKFKNLLDAQSKVPFYQNKNLQIHYNDYFGFTTDRTIRNNDIYYNQEIFFSKKCYEELNLIGEVITGDFSGRRAFKTVPPRSKQYICGLVENGEKGLFFRKWFVCSKEFLTLWTMICESDHYSLKTRIDNKYITKSLEEILKEVDGVHYDISNFELSISQMQENFKIYNIENAIIYQADLYQKIILSIFNPSALEDELDNYGDQIKKDLIWMK